MNTQTQPPAAGEAANTDTTTTPRATGNDAHTVGELRSIATADIKFRITHEGPQVLDQVREWRKAFVDSRHPAARCMWAAGVIMQDMLDFINRQEQEIQTWQAFAEQANKCNDDLLKTVSRLRAGLIEVSSLAESGNASSLRDFRDIATDSLRCVSITIPERPSSINRPTTSPEIKA